MASKGPPTLKRKPDWLLVEAWKNNRKILARILGDAIIAMIVVGCATVVGFVVRIAPGATPDHLQLFDTYHFFSIFGLSAFFTLLLVLEVLVTFIRRIGRKGPPDA